MDNDALRHHLKHLKRDRSNPWPDLTKGGAPQKPLLLLATINAISLPGEFWSELNNDIFREEIKRLLIDIYFDETGQGIIRHTLDNQKQTFLYADELIRRPERVNEITISKPVRDAGFRRVVRHAYDNRCAMSGIRIVTDEGRALVQAAHIHSWADNYDDRPVNGIALSPDCHWCFDQGLLRIHPQNLTIHCDKTISEAFNIPAHLQAFHGRPIVIPDDPKFQPDLECLEWRWTHPTG